MSFRASKKLVTIWALLISGCGQSHLVDQNGNSISKVSDVPVQNDMSPPSIVSFLPAQGAYTHIPTTVTIAFSKEVLDTATDPNNYELHCTDGAHPLTGITLTGWKAVLTLPDLSSLSDGDICELTALEGIEDLYEQKLTGNTKVTYRVSATGSGPTDTIAPIAKFVSPLDLDRVFGKSVTLQVNASDPLNLDGTPGSGVSLVEYFIDGTLVGSSMSAPFSFTLDSSTVTNGLKRLTVDVTDQSGNRTQEADVATIHIANNDITLSDAVGGTGGTAFTDNAPNGMVLAGFKIHAGSYIDRVQPIWKNAWGSSASTLGATHGGTGGSGVDLVCPTDANYRVVGIFGLEDRFVNRLGIICRRMDGSGYTYRSPNPAGGTNGIAYDFTCESGTFITQIKGRAGQYVDQLQLGCQ